MKVIRFSAGNVAGSSWFKYLCTLAADSAHQEEVQLFGVIYDDRLKQREADLGARR